MAVGVSRGNTDGSIPTNHWASLRLYTRTDVVDAVEEKIDVSLVQAAEGGRDAGVVPVVAPSAVTPTSSGVNEGRSAEREGQDSTESSIQRLLAVPPWDYDTAVRVQACECPSGNPYAISHTGDFGLMQINAATWDWWLNQRGFDFWNTWMIPKENIRMAWEIQKEYGWGEWGCY